MPPLKSAGVIGRVTDALRRLPCDGKCEPFCAFHTLLLSKIYLLALVASHSRILRRREKHKPPKADVGRSNSKPDNSVQSPPIRVPLAVS